MPNRVIREGIRTSERVCYLTPLERWLFVTLMTTVDDFGRYFANPILIAGTCLPFDGQTPDNVRQMLARLASAGLILLYEADGRAYLEIQDFKQRTRQTKSKYPAPSDGSQMTVNRPSNDGLDVDVDVDVDVILSDSNETDETMTVEYCKERWNEIAEHHQWLSSVQRMSAKRMNKLRLRLRENPDFWQTVETRLHRVGPFVRESKWFGLDWLIENDTNFLKFAEGKYDDVGAAMREGQCL